MTEAFVYDAIRTPRGKGKPSGALHGVKPITLVHGLIDELRERNPNLDPGRIDDLVLGIVSAVGDQGGVLPRTVALAAGLPDTVAGVQLNRYCASGLEAVNLAAQKVRSGWDHLVARRRRGEHVAGSRSAPAAAPGWETRRPHFGTGFVPQGVSADLIATLEGFSRDDVDAYAVESQQRAAKACGRRLLRRVGGAGAGSQRSRRARPGRASCARTPPSTAWAR